MPDIDRIEDVDKPEDLRHQRAMWTVERVGWICMALLLIAALAGLLGSGPLSGVIAGAKGSGLWVEYNRFDRHEAPAVLRVHIGPGVARAGQVRLWLSAAYIEKAEIKRIDPEPERVEMSGERMIFVFPVTDPNQPMEATFHLDPTGFGLRPVRFGVEGGPEVQFTQLIYP